MTNKWSHKVNRIDQMVEGFSAKIRNKWQLFDSIVEFFARYGPFMFFFEMLTLCVISMIHSHVFWRPVFSVLIAVISAVTTKWVIDPIARKVNRLRPFVRLNYAPLIAKNPLDPSFPSNHAGGSFALATVLLFRFPGAWEVSLLLALAVVFARIYVGLHFFSDIFAGALIGSVIAIMFLSVFR